MSTNHIIDKVRNKEVRERFNQYREEHFSPSMNLMAEEIGINHSYLVRWKNEFVDLAEKLELVEAFLIKHDK